MNTLEKLINPCFLWAAFIAISVAIFWLKQTFKKKD